MMDKSLSVILGCDPLLGPMTGIGHYTKQLGLALQQHPDVNELKLFAHTSFFSDGLLGDVTRQTSKQKANAFTKLRSALAGNRIAVSMYESIMPYIASHRLKAFKNSHILHSPNFVLPPFDGPSVVTFHDLSPVMLPQYHPSVRAGFVSREMEKVVNGNAHIITDTEFVKRQIIDFYNVDESRVSAVHLACDAGFKPHSSEECAATLSALNLSYKEYFLFVSTIEPRKNLLRLLKAFELYREKTERPLPLVIVGGSGWDSEEEHNEIKRLQSRGLVNYLGYAPQEIMHQLYAGAVGLLFPSEYEGFGLPIVEAMQSGTAVLTTQDSAMSEVAGGAAVLVDYIDVDVMATGIQRIAEDGVFRSRLEQAGLERADSFSWTKCAQQTVDVYQLLK